MLRHPHQPQSLKPATTIMLSHPQTMMSLLLGMMSKNPTPLSNSHPGPLLLLSLLLLLLLWCSARIIQEPIIR